MLFCIAFLQISRAQNSSSPSEPIEAIDENKKGFAISVGVDEVQLDVVVLDKDGHQITDLTSDDFEIYQDGKLQKTESSIYMNDNQSMPQKRKKKPADAWPAQISSTPMLGSDKVRRTILLVLDDLEMSYWDLKSARQTVKKFVENEMQSGDMVAITRTGNGSSAQQLFSSDKQQLLSIIKSMRWGRVIGPYQTSGITRIDDYWGKVAYESLKEGREKHQPFDMDVVHFQISVLRYCVRALRDMPGRKSILFVSPHTTRPWHTAPQTMTMLNDLGDEAMRAGVVIHTLDITGVDIIFRKDLPLSAKTGGAFLRDVGFWATKSGIGPASELIKGFYLLSYTPPNGTFSKSRPETTAPYHHITVKVKRGTVYTRDGFYGIDNDRIAAEPRARTKSLQEVLYSPFRYNDLDVRLASGYAFIPNLGYYIRTWLHIDGKHLAFVEGSNGEKSIALEVSLAITDDKSLICNSRGARYSVPVKDEDLPSIRKNGFDFAFYQHFKDISEYNVTGLNKKKDNDDPSYLVRAAVRDLASGKAGSTYQFLKVFDVKKKKRLMLSSIFPFNRNQDLDEIKTGSGDDNHANVTLNWLSPTRSPALRSYLQGEGFDYVLIAYNGKEAGKSTPELESQIILYKDGQEFSKGAIEDVDVSGAKDPNMIPIVKRFVFGENLEPGDYVLQFGIRDKNPIKKMRAAIQAIDFQITQKNAADSDGKSK
jgi:VWFA-related protein